MTEKAKIIIGVDKYMLVCFTPILHQHNGVKIKRWNNNNSDTPKDMLSTHISPHHFPTIKKTFEIGMYNHTTLFN